MLKNNKFNMVLAVIAAIVLWAYVLGEINPPSKAVIRNVPISFENEQTLERDGLTLLSSSSTTVDINISGQRTAVTQVSKDDFSVVADLEALPAGENIVRLSISGPSNVKIENTDVEKIKVVVDYIQKSEQNIEVVVTGEDADKEAYVVQLSRQTAVVSGPKTKVDTVVGLAAYIDINEIQNQMKTFTCDLIAVDGQGNQVEGVAVEGQDRVNVTAVLFTKKTVPLEVAVINPQEEGIERKYTVPKTVVIKGAESDLANVDKIVCDTVDLKNISESMAVTLMPRLPEGIQLANVSKNLTMEVSVKVKDNITKTFELDSAGVILNGQNEALKYNLQQIKIKLDITGRENEISGLTEKDFDIFADVSGLEAGSHEIRLSAKCHKENVDINISPETIEVTIEAVR